jgi:S1-C subfamily serine protease
MVDRKSEYGIFDKNIFQNFKFFWAQKEKTMKRLFWMFSIMVLIIVFAGCTAHYSPLEPGQTESVEKKETTKTTKSVPQDISKKEITEITEESSKSDVKGKTAKIVIARDEEIVEMLLELIDDKFPGATEIRLHKKRKRLRFNYYNFWLGAVAVTIKLKPVAGIDQNGVRVKGYLIDILSKSRASNPTLIPGYAIERINDGLPKHMKEFELSYTSVTNVKPVRIRKVTTYAGQGTGFLLGDRSLVVTNFHVVGEKEKADLFFQGGQKVSGRVVKRDKENDLAIIKFDEFRDKPKGFKIYPSHKMKSGQEVSVIGFPLGSLLGENPGITKGMIAATVGIRNDSRHFRITAQINPGNSGGPLINKQGKVVGVVSHSLNALYLAQTHGIIPEGANFAIKSSLLLSLLPDTSGLVASEESRALTNEEIFANYSKAVVIVRIPEW